MSTMTDEQFAEALAAAIAASGDERLDDDERDALYPFPTNLVQAAMVGKQATKLACATYETEADLLSNAARILAEFAEGLRTWFTQDNVDDGVNGGDLVDYVSEWLDGRKAAPPEPYVGEVAYVRGVAYDQGYRVYDFPSEACVPTQADADWDIFDGDIPAAEAKAEELERVTGVAHYVGWHHDPRPSVRPSLIANRGDVWVSPNPTDQGPHNVEVIDDDE